jgi:hypothetical protein
MGNLAWKSWHLKYIVRYSEVRFRLYMRCERASKGSRGSDGWRILLPQALLLIHLHVVPTVLYCNSRDLNLSQKTPVQHQISNASRTVQRGYPVYRVKAERRHRTSAWYVHTHSFYHSIILSTI